MIFTLSARRAMFAAIALIPLVVSAQTVTDDPKNPDAVVSAPPYHSVFSDYKSYQDPDIQSWKKANADVRQSDSMKASGMGGMHGMSDKSMGDMKANSPAPAAKKTASPSAQMPPSMPSMPSMPAHDGMPSR
ncbi:hypothetical protein [Glaciimonas immobilis]|uniref:Uncharacterized protein n=1 Tax=Glaciimonas immobilis TaxID=728004 RepID=A0A840RUZ8_9BURK|nr:hypothetical protein [Glaciimonas immobilis]KAF3995970.1 hypothetical protein HAV38_20910 [Glaciimonas immobilis]MBB5202437.1 hypothetical protein [Glaciimonas immobilis]